MTSGVTRRSLLARAAVGLTGGALASLLSACSSAGQAPAATTASKPSGATPAAPAATTAPAAGATTAPAATSAPAAAATSSAPAASAGRGAGGSLRVLMWQGPTILNPHLTQGTKDFIAARFCCEPLLTVSGDGKFSPVLAAEVPTRENGGLGADGKTVTYKLKQGVKWADGEPFTADDVVFTFQYITNKETAATTYGTFADLDKVEAVDATTVRLTFKQATGGWYVPFTGSNGMVVPKHALEKYIGSASRDAPFNLKGFGTGPYMAQEFKPGDVVTLVANPNYREANKPFFSQVDIKGGGDAVSSARAVFQTGEYDYAWNLQVEAQVLTQLLQAGKGDLVLGAGGGVEQILLNQTDPNVEVDGERSSLKTKHPFLTDQRVRQALALAIDRATIAKQLYGQTGDATANVLTTPTNLASTATAFEFNIEKANQLLDQAGYKRGGDGVRTTPDGTRMHLLYQTTTNSLRQKEQDIVKQGWQQIGVETELKSVDASIYFSADVGNPDTTGHFYADAQMLTATFDAPFPLAYMKRFYGETPEIDLPQQANKWAPPNSMRWSNDEYNKLYDQVKTEIDVQKATQLWMQLNDIVVNAYVSVPLVDRKSADGKLKAIQGPELSPFEPWSWNVADWTKNS
jgi:peptide/nickel transport system substrate-binding protein